jgi:hypothetical protein
MDVIRTLSRNTLASLVRRHELGSTKRHKVELAAIVRKANLPLETLLLAHYEQLEYEAELQERRNLRIQPSAFQPGDLVQWSVYTGTVQRVLRWYVVVDIGGGETRHVRAYRLKRVTHNDVVEPVVHHPLDPSLDV